MIRRAMIFAAGRGERMRPLTDATPKPLLRVGGKMLIEHHLEKLAAPAYAKSSSTPRIWPSSFRRRSAMARAGACASATATKGAKPLETGGGMKHALPLLGDAPFIGVSADIVSDYDYAQLPAEPDGLAHLVMVPNPDFHPRGDFWLDGTRLNEDGVGERLTFGNIGVYRPELVAGEAATLQAAADFQRAMRDGALSGERYDGFWREHRHAGRNCATPSSRSREGGNLAPSLESPNALVLAFAGTTRSYSAIEQLAQKRHRHAALRRERRASTRSSTSSSDAEVALRRARTTSRARRRRARCRARPRVRATTRGAPSSSSGLSATCVHADSRDTRSGRPMPSLRRRRARGEQQRRAFRAATVVEIEQRVLGIGSPAIASRSSIASTVAATEARIAAERVAARSVASGRYCALRPASFAAAHAAISRCVRPLPAAPARYTHRRPLRARRRAAARPRRRCRPRGMRRSAGAPASAARAAICALMRLRAAGAVSLGMRSATTIASPRSHFRRRRRRSRAPRSSDTARSRV